MSLPRDRTVLVGGLSSLHDPLGAAALRGLGYRAETLHPRTDVGLRAARGLGNHGQCNPAQYAVGAVLEHAKASGLPPAHFAQRHAWLTVSACGPCRLAAYPLEYRRVLTAAGLGALPVLQLDQLAFVDAPLVRSPLAPTLGPEELEALVRAVLAGDVVTAFGHQLRPFVEDPDALERTLAQGVEALTVRLQRGAAVEPALAELGAHARALPRRCRVVPRVLLVGEPWTILADGDPSYDLVARLERLGAEVEAPLAIDWLRQLLHQSRASHPALVDAVDAQLQCTFRRLAEAAGLDLTLDDPAELAALAAPHYSPDVRGGSAHLEVGRTMRALQRGRVHLVLSIKPFGCMPSSSLSDGVLAPLLRAYPNGPAFLAVETTGDADAAVESRVEMALHTATLRAMGEAGAR